MQEQDEENEQQHDRADIAEAPARARDAADVFLRRDLRQHCVVVDLGEVGEHLADREQRRTEHEELRLGEHEKHREHACDRDAGEEREIELSLLGAIRGAAECRSDHRNDDRGREIEPAHDLLRSGLRVEVRRVFGVERPECRDFRVEEIVGCEIGREDEGHHDRLER